MSQTTSAFLYLISMLSGGAGGAGAASWHVLAGRPVTRQLLLAYIVVGVVVGVFVDAWVMVWAITAGIGGELIHHLIGLGLGSGFLASTALALIRKIACIALKWKGIEVEVKLRDPGRGDV